MYYRCTLVTMHKSYGIHLNPAYNGRNCTSLTLFSTTCIQCYVSDGMLLMIIKLICLCRCFERTPYECLNYNGCRMTQRVLTCGSYASFLQPFHCALIVISGRISSMKALSSGVLHKMVVFYFIY